MANLKESHYYYSIFRKSIIAFGSVFNNLIVKRKSEGGVLESYKVPVRYGPSEKFIALIEAEQRGKRPPIALTMPFISFEIEGLNYDSSRKVVPTQFMKTYPGPQSDSTSAYKQYMPVPYNLQLNLTIAAKNQDDGLQCLEQILPLFHPNLHVSIVVIDETHEERDIGIVLNNVAYDDTYEGDFTDRRVIQWNLSFTVMTYLFGPIDPEKEIRKVTIDWRSAVSRPAELRYSAEAVTEKPTKSGEPEKVKIIEQYEDIYSTDNDYFALD